MKKFTNKLSKLFALALVTILTLSTSSAFADSNIANGRYTLTNDTKYLEDNETGEAMARSYTDKSMTLEKKDGKIYYTVGLSGAQYMNNHRIYVNGKSVSIQKVSENTSAGTLKLKFPVNSASDTILIKFYVTMMERDVEYQLIPNLNSLSLVESYEEAKTESKKEQSTTTSSSNKTETKPESTSSTKTETKVESTTTSTEKEEVKDEEKVETTTEENKEVEAKEETETVSTEKQETENVETSVKESSQNNTSTIVIISVIVILAAIIIFVLFKRKK